MQSATFFIREVIAFVIRDEIDESSVGQRRRFVETDAPVLNGCSKGAHVPTIRACSAARNPSRKLWNAGDAEMKLGALADSAFDPDAPAVGVYDMTRDS